MNPKSRTMVLQMIQERVPLRDIAKASGWPAADIRNLALEANLPMTLTGTDEFVVQARPFRDQGYTWKEIADKFGISETAAMQRWSRGTREERLRARMAARAAAQEVP